MDQPQPATTKPPNVLIIEDERFISELYVRALTKAGFTVKVAVDGLEGLKEAQTDAYDIILLDIMVPNLTGTEILARLRDKTVTPKLHGKIIITTNLDQGENGRDVVESQADGYIIKAEITPKQLVEFLKQLKLN